MNIKKRTNELIKRYKTRDPFEMIKGMNVILLFCPLENVRGFYQYYKRNHIIYINEQLSEHEKKFVCAHELGHMILHKGENTIFMDTRTHFNTNKYELEANDFAVNLLISDENIAKYCEYTSKQLATIFGLSEELILLRL